MNTQSIIDNDMDYERWRVNMVMLASGASLYTPLGVMIMLGSSWSYPIFFSYLACSLSYWVAFSLGFKERFKRSSSTQPLEFCFYVAFVHQIALLHITHVHISQVLSATILFSASFISLGYSTYGFLILYPILIQLGLGSLIFIQTDFPVKAFALGYSPLVVFAMVQGRIRFRMMAELKINREKLANAFQTSKLSSLGQMASGVAHEINNPLAIVIACADQLEENFSDPKVKELLPETSSRIFQRLETIRKNSMRISQIIQKLRLLSKEKKEEDVFSLTVLNNIVEDTLDLFNERLRINEITLIYTPSTTPIKVQAKSQQLIEVVFNLMSNAFDAIKNEKEQWIKIDVYEKDGNAFIAVTDSGPGIKENIKDKIFDPFFSTKAIGTGTGLGLSTSLGIMNTHKGTLSVDGTSKNTRFIISIPISP